MTAEHNLVPARILIDTNVWLDSYIGSRSGCKAARGLITAARAKNIELLYPVHTIKDVFFLIRTTLKAQERAAKGSLSEEMALAITESAWGCVENMRANATAVGADQSDVWLAFKYRALLPDLEDDLVLAACERAQADMLVTSDRQLIAKATVPAHTPADAALLLQL